MVIFLYSDKNFEYQAISCIKSFEKKITDDLQVMYFTIGFDSNFECKNLSKYRVDNLSYPLFNYYKAELSLKVLELFPEEKHFIFTDTDVLFSKRIEFEKLKNNHTYPLGVFGPHEYPFIYEIIDGEFIQYNEKKLMDYMNVTDRSMMYQWSCFYTFNRDCMDFLEEYTSICKNQYLLNRRKWYFPFQDETAFNICLWKRNATESLGHIFVNTHLIDTIKMVEENEIKELSTNNVIDSLGAQWEYVKDSSRIMFYHGVKNKNDIDSILGYLIDT